MSDSRSAGIDTPADRRALVIGAVAILTALAVLIVGWSWARNRVLAEAEAGLRAELLDRARGTSRGLEVWAGNQTDTAVLWAGDPRVVDLASQLDRAARTTDDLLAASAQDELRRLLAPVLDAHGFRGYFVVAADGVSLASTRDANTGTPNLIWEQERDRFERILAGETMVLPPQFTDVPLVGADGELDPDAMTMFVGTPIELEGGVGVFLFRLDPEESFNRFYEVRTFGDTGETFAFDVDGRLFIAPRFAADAAAAGTVDPEALGDVRLVDPTVGGGVALTRLASSAATGATDSALDYVSYHGDAVAGAWTWSEVLDIGTGVEVRTAEAMAGPAFVRRTIDAFAAMALLALVPISAFFLAWQRRDRRERRRIAIHNAQLAEAELTQRHLAERLAASNADLESFASIAAHDLQEPLRKVQAFGDRLALSQEDLEPRARDSLERMISAAGRMRTLVDDLLEYSRVSAPSIPDNTVDLDIVVAMAIEDLDLESRGAAVMVHDPLPRVRGDAVQLARLVTNLVGNAIKFRHPDRAPVVRVAPADAEDGFFAIEVADNGIGFEEAQAERIFAPYERLHNRSRFEGSGMGLAISRRIVERHGGTLSAHGTPGEGARFVVTLPGPTKG